MSGVTLATKGQTAIAEKKYDEAVSLLTQALSTSQSPLWLLNRSTAYQRLQKHDLALADADNAYLAARSRSRRELMATAQFRRAVALHGLKRFGDARMCLNWCRKLNEKEKALTIWQAKVKSDFEAAEKEGLEDRVRVTIKEVPDPVEEVKVVKEVEKKEETTSKSVSATPSAPIQTTTKEKIKHDWYQSSQSVTITILAKGVPKDQASILIEEGSLEVSFPINSSDTYDFTLSPLFARIDPKKSSSRITPHKIEIVLSKAIPNIKWSNLEGTEPIVSSETTTEPPTSQPTTKKENVPHYPTSSRTGPKNWDTIGKDADGDDNDESSPDAFFKTIFAGADPDTKRAMMKSYTESNGTALSTNWAEVSKGKVETNPPEGVKAVPWDQKT